MIMQLKPVLGPLQLVSYSVGVIVGAGIYSVIGAAAGLAQQSLWLSFVIGAIAALLTGFSYAEMTTSLPHAGAEYLYLKRAFPASGWAAFGVGFLILMGGAATAATVAVAFGGYILAFTQTPIWLSALLLIAACTALNIWGLREAGWANAVFTAIEISGLVLVVAAGMAAGDLAAPLSFAPSSGVLPAAALVFFVYLGFEEIANLAEEACDPARNLPRAIFFSIGITTLLYVLVALAVVSLVDSNELALNTAPLALAIGKAWPGFESVLAGIAIFATANTVLITVIAGSRLAFSMARDGELPPAFTTLSPMRRTPWAAALLICCLSAIMLPIGNVRMLAELSSFAALLAFFAVNIALIVMRYRQPDLPRPFRVPLAIGWMPILPLAAIVSICVLLANFDWRVYAFGIGFLLLMWLIVLMRGLRRNAGAQ
jgi:amino acid transporter